MDMLRAVKSGFWDIPLCIPVDGYEVKGPHATTLTDLTFQLKRYVPEDGWRYMGL
jgi:hypothetical protein